MRRALSKSPRGGEEEAAFCVCAWRVGGRQRCSRSGGTFHADFELFGRFSFPQPRHGAGERVSVMLRSGGTGLGHSPPRT